MKVILICTVAFFAVISEIAYAQEATDTIEANRPVCNYSGNIRGFAFAGSERFDYSCALAEVRFGVDASVKKTLTFRSDLRFRYGYQFNEENTILNLREAYAGFVSKPFSVTLGKKVLDWSRVDAYSVSNRLTPTDYFYFSPDADDQKLSQWMMHTKVMFGNRISWQIAAIPFFNPSVYRFDLFDMGENAVFEQAVMPERTFSNGSIASRLNFELNAIGFAFSFFEGYSTEYGFTLSGVNFFNDPIEAILRPVYHRMRSASCDFEVPAGSWIFRGELAYNQIKDTGNMMYLPRNGFHYVFAVEKSFFNITSMAEYIGHFTMDFEPLVTPTNVIEDMLYQLFNFNRQIFYQQNKFNHAAALILARDFLYGTIQANLALYYNITSEEFTVRPQISYSVNDNLKVTVGGMYMRGPENSIFSYSSEIMNGAFVQLKASF